MLAAPASATTALDAAIAEALSMVGKNVAQVNAAMADGAWKNTAPTQWCAWFASYICRAAGVSRQTSSLALYNSLPHSGTPQRGDIIYYSTPGHTEFVYDVVNGVPRAIGGNTPGDPDPIVKIHNTPISGYVITGFAHPNWGAAPPPSGSTQDEDDMVRFIAATGSDTYGGRSVGANTWAAIEGGAFTRISSSEELDALADSMGITRTVLENERKKNVSGRSFLLTESVYIRMNP
ncbi:MAG TPA: CHAP domain-containing protein [Pseudolysinimonas sp.]|nr:CHAP domain-containing protein [Pseudolysinimonas sp.]